MFNKCSPRSIFCCLFTVCTNDTHILSRNCPPDVHPRTNFRVSSAFPFAFVSSTEFFQFFFFFFSFFVVLSRGHTRIERTIVHLFFSSPSPHFNNESSKRLERGKARNLFLQIRDYFNFSTIFRGRRRIFATSENSWKVGSVQFIALVNPPRALFTEDSRDKKPGWAQ